MGGARNIGIKQHTIERFKKVEELLRQTEPKVKLKDALERFKLNSSTYYRLKERFENEAGT